MLERLDGKLSRAVLRGRGGSNASLLPDLEKDFRLWGVIMVIVSAKIHGHKKRLVENDSSASYRLLRLILIQVFSGNAYTLFGA